MNIYSYYATKMLVTVYSLPINCAKIICNKIFLEIKSYLLQWYLNNSKLRELVTNFKLSKIQVTEKSQN